MPIHEAVNAAEALQNISPGAKQQVIGIDQKHPRASRLQIVECLAFDGCLGSDRHEDRSLDLAMKSEELCRPCLGSTGLLFQDEVQSSFHRS